MVDDEFYLPTSCLFAIPPPAKITVSSLSSSSVDDSFFSLVVFCNVVVTFLRRATFARHRITRLFSRVNAITGIRIDRVNSNPPSDSTENRCCRFCHSSHIHTHTRACQTHRQIVVSVLGKVMNNENSYLSEISALFRNECMNRLPRRLCHFQLRSDFSNEMEYTECCVIYERDVMEDGKGGTHTHTHTPHSDRLHVMLCSPIFLFLIFRFFCI